MKNKQINVLILSAGRRVELIECFQNAREKAGVFSKVIAADISPLAPALYYADEYRLIPRIGEENYIQSIINLCTEKTIKIIIPTIDTELLVLSKNKEIIENATGTKVLVSDLGVINICRDKIKTQKFLEENGFNIPKMYSDKEIMEGKITLPLFIKPKSGSSSKNTFKIDSILELNYLYNSIKDPIVQDFIQGEEYSVDAFLDFKGKIISIVPRLRIATRDGEISKGKIVKDKEIIETIRKLMNILKPIGHITIQLMKTKKGIEFIEINPRFGGGAPMSIMSGADSCEYLYRILLGEELEYNENYRDNLTYLRFDRSVCINDKNEVVE